MLVGASLEQYPLWEYRVPIAAGLVGLIAVEMIYRVIAHRQPPSVATTINDSVIFGVNLIERGATLSLRLAVFMWVAQFAPVRVAWGPWTILGAYVLIDFIYYWKHRLFHRTRLGWALHSTHHSSESLNFLATFRLNWIEAFLSYFFFAPLALLGFDPLLLFVLIEINDGWQFVCHTEIVNPVRWLDRWFNTPNIHRVHHSRRKELADRNYGSTFMIWDRLFGTYHPGLSATEYGLGEGPKLANVLTIQFGPLWNLVAGSKRRTPGPSPDSRSEPH